MESQKPESKLPVGITEVEVEKLPKEKVIEGLELLALTCEPAEKKPIEAVINRLRLRLQSPSAHS